MYTENDWIEFVHAWQYNKCMHRFISLLDWCIINLSKNIGGYKKEEIDGDVYYKKMMDLTTSHQNKKRK